MKQPSSRQDPRVSERLLRGTKGEDREKLKQNLIHAQWVLDLIKGLVEDDLRASTARMRSDDAYEVASWPYAQADHLGYQRALAKVLKYVTLDREDRNE